MIRVLPLTWSRVGSDLIKSGAMGTTYTVFRHTNGPWIAQADGLTVYTGDDIEAAKQAIQDKHAEWVSALVLASEVPE